LELTTRNQRLVLERARGDTLDTIGQRHGISHQRVHMVVREATEHVNQIELELMVARKTGHVCSLLVPYQAQEDRQLALNYFDWVVAQLRAREVDVKATHIPTTAGSVFLLEDVTQYGKVNS
jgi:hypothetical protein